MRIGESWHYSIALQVDDFGAGALIGLCCGVGTDKDKLARADCDGFRACLAIVDRVDVTVDEDGVGFGRRRFAWDKPQKCGDQHQGEHSHIDPPFTRWKYRLEEDGTEGTGQYSSQRQRGLFAGRGTTPRAPQ